MPNVEKLIIELKAKYTDAIEKIISIVQSEPKSADIDQYEKQLKAEINKLQVELNEYSVKWSKKTIPIPYYDGVDNANTILKKAGEVAKRSHPLHIAALETMISDTYMLLQESNYFFARQIFDNIRDISVELTELKLAKGETVQQMRNKLLERLEKEGVRGIRTSDGRFIQVDAYASTVARSTTREATNLGVMNQSTASGYDLVQVSTHSPTCNICAPYQGRIYSISGNDPRFPALRETAFSSGYANIHPNCRHVLMPVVWDMLDEEEQLRYLADAKKPFLDNRSEREKALYDRQQKDNRERRRDLLQWRRYQERLGKENVPKTFSGFRRSKKSQSENWQRMQAEYRAKGYERKADGAPK